MGRGRGRPRTNFDVDSGNYQPTEADMQEDVSIDARPEDVAQSLFPKGPPVVESGKGEQVKKEWDAWLKSRGV